MYRRIVWWLVFLSVGFPFIILSLTYLLSPRTLGIDAVDVLLGESGEWTLRLLLLTLVCSPLKRLGLKKIMRFRRMFGLYTFFYATWHLMIYFIGWLQLDWATFVEDITKRPFIYIGMLTWVILLILAITSPKWVVSKLRKKWISLHKLVYLALILAWVHLWMQSRASGTEAFVYLSFISVLLGERLHRKYGKPLLVNQKNWARFKTLRSHLKKRKESS